MIKENGDAVHVNHRDHLGMELTEIPYTFSNISAESTNYSWYLLSHC